MRKTYRGDRRRFAREAFCFILGSILSLGGVIPVLFVSNTKDEPSLLSYLDSPGVLSDQDRTATDAAVTKCRAVMRKCRDDALLLAKGEAAKNKQVRRSPKIIAESTTLTFDPGAKKTPLFKQSKAPPCNVNRSPFATMLPFYPHRALENEIHKHDRFVVDSISYINAFDGGENEAYQPPAQSPKAITLVILTVNRLVPYLAVLMASLLRGHDPSTLGKYVDLHVINIERRPCRCSYQLLSDLEEKLPFVTFHDWTAPYPQHANITDDTLRMYKSNQRVDYIRVLELCIEKKSKWCLVMEDDAIMTANLVPKFLNLTFDINVAELGVLALYVPYNDHWGGDNSIRRESYAKGSYDEDTKALKFMDPDTLHGSTPRIMYQIKDLGEVTYGVVANAYPSSVLDRMVKFLGRDDSRTSDYTDVALMNVFAKETGLRKLGTHPSIVNHVGHYSEHKSDVNKIDSKSTEERCYSRMFHAMSMDVRFQLDDGWEVGNNPVKGEPES